MIQGNHTPQNFCRPARDRGKSGEDFERAEEGPVTTAVIPPPIEKEPAASAEPEKQVTAEGKPEAAPEPEKGAKHHKRTARRTHYARRLYMPYLRWYFETKAGTRDGEVAVRIFAHLSNGQ